MSDKPATFSLATLFWVTAAVAVHTCMCQWERIPLWHPTPVVYNAILASSFVAACFVAKRYQNADLAWSLIAIGWLLAGLLLMKRLPHALSAFSSHDLSVNFVQREVVVTFAIYTAMPFTLGLPAVYLACRVSAKPSYARKWVITTLIIGVLDCLLVTVFCWVMAAFIYSLE